MITFPALPGFDCANEGFAHYFANNMAIDGWTMEDLGESSSAGLNLYGLYRGLDTGKPVVYIQSGVHGDEWPNVFWARAFATYLANPHLAPESVRHYFKLLDNTFAFYWMPIANPYGYDVVQRGNANDVNFNGDYGATQTQPESILIKSKFITLKPIALIDNHTWDNANTPCHRLYGRKGTGTDSQYREISYNLIKAIQLITNEKVWEYWFAASTDHFHGWSTLQTAKHGLNCMTFLIEGDKLESPSVQTKQGLNAMLAFSLYFYTWYKKRIENSVKSDILAS